MGKYDVVLQERDIWFLFELGLVGCMSSLVAFLRWYRRDDGDEESQLVYFRRRMRDFARMGYIDLTIVMFNDGKAARRYPNIIRLLPAGAEVVEEQTGLTPPRPARSDPPRAMTLHHRAGVTRCLLAFLDAAKEQGLTRLPFILEQDRHPEASMTDRADAQFVLREVFVNGDRRMVVRPDMALLIELPDTKQHKMCAYMEFDRATETRKDFLRMHTNGGYALLVDPERHLYRKHFAQADLARILVVVPSAGRRDSIMQWVRGRAEAPYYRIAVEEDIVASKVLTAKIWQDVRGKFLSIFP